MSLVLGFGLSVLAVLFALATAVTTWITVVFRQPGLLVLAAMFAAITVLLIASAWRIA